MPVDSTGILYEVNTFSPSIIAFSPTLAHTRRTFYFLPATANLCSLFMRKIIFPLCFMLSGLSLSAQDMKDMWTREAATSAHPGLSWFREAKFGLFIHWGLYSRPGGSWKDSSYYGSGEWLQQRAKIPAAEYAAVADSFNPVGFDANEWASMAKAAGIRYMVVTSKHHEGFSMYGSRVSRFNIVDASPYKKDPMKALAAACRDKGIPFGFYYSQFQDWHEPNGGGNGWDFDKTKKDYRLYYQQKAIPQLKELLTGYGPLGIIWFDTPGGLTKAETKTMIDSLRQLQPGCLFSSRVGHGLGDYRDFGDSEVPPAPIAGAWESIYTHNDSWGYISHDHNFKSPQTIIRLLANVASKGGNLMLNVGPDGNGRWPEASVRYLAATGKWLQQFGEGIYGTTHGLLPAQPWGVTTSKPKRLYLHVMQPPVNRQLYLPHFTARITGVTITGTRKVLQWSQQADGVVITLPPTLPDARNTVITVNYSGQQADHSADREQTVSRQYPLQEIPVVYATNKGNTKQQVFTFSHYFGDWKHENCATGLQAPTDELEFSLLVQEPGDYKISLDYACTPAAAGQEGVLGLAGNELHFLTLPTGEYDSHKPLLFIQHAVGIIHVEKAGHYPLRISPAKSYGKDLFKLKKVILEPVY